MDGSTPDKPAHAVSDFHASVCAMLPSSPGMQRRSAGTLNMKDPVITAAFK